ncbi:hypothetical protein ABGB16_17995 [Micromonospora sp. B11E3]|uniref:hypothetical protein n=1 Tax=Micromonospora sp. B11E3 TaxID=3153562 RepID=UPI00325E330F
MHLPPWAGPHAPLPVARDAASIAQHASYYFRGYQAGARVAVQSVGTPAAVLPSPVIVPLPESGRRSSRVRTPATIASAMRLVGVVLRFIPEVERPRYGEEFRAELAELRGLRQLAYAARLLVSAPALRRSLREDPLGGKGGGWWPFAG